MHSVQHNIGYFPLAHKLPQKEYLRLSEEKQNDPPQEGISPQKAQVPCSAKQGPKFQDWSLGSPLEVVADA